MTEHNPFDPTQPASAVPPPPAPGYPPPPAFPPGGYNPQAVYGYPPDAGAPFGRDMYGRPLSDKSKLVAGLLQILLGGLGIGRFYTGDTGLAVGQLLVTLFTCGLGGIWGLVDGILILVKDDWTDARGLYLRAG